MILKNPREDKHYINRMYLSVPFFNVFYRLERYYVVLLEEIWLTNG